MVGKRPRGAFFIPGSGLIGIEQIDKEHLAVVEALEIVRQHIDHDQEVSRTKTREVVDLIIGHFRDEEELMRREEYPHLDAHIRHHDQSLAQLYRILGNTDLAGGVTQGDLQDIYRNLLDDIFSADMNFSAYLNDRSDRGDRDK